jgi:hypothetical protein
MTDSQVQSSSSADETGSVASGLKLVSTQFGPYTVTVRLKATGEFVDVYAIRLATDFRSSIQRMQSSGFHDVSDLYVDKVE